MLTFVHQFHFKEKIQLKKVMRVSTSAAHLKLFVPRKYAELSE